MKDNKQYLLNILKRLFNLKMKKSKTKSKKTKVKAHVGPPGKLSKYRVKLKQSGYSNFGDVYKTRNGRKYLKRVYPDGRILYMPCKMYKAHHGERFQLYH